MSMPADLRFRHVLVRLVDQRELAVRVQRDVLALVLIVLDVAGVDDVLREELLDRAFEVDAQPVDRDVESLDPLRPVDDADGVRIGLLRFHFGVATLQDRHRHVGCRSRLAWIANRSGTARAVEALAEIGRAHVARVGAAQPDLIREGAESRPALYVQIVAAAAVVRPTRRRVEVQLLQPARAAKEARGLR